MPSLSPAVARPTLPGWFRSNGTLCCLMGFRLRQRQAETRTRLVSSTCSSPETSTSQFLDSPRCFDVQQDKRLDVLVLLHHPIFSTQNTCSRRLLSQSTVSPRRAWAPTLPLQQCDVGKRRRDGGLESRDCTIAPNIIRVLLIPVHKNRIHGSTVIENKRHGVFSTDCWDHCEI